MNLTIMTVAFFLKQAKKIFKFLRKTNFKTEPQKNSDKGNTNTDTKIYRKFVLFEPKIEISVKLYLLEIG